MFFSFLPPWTPAKLQNPIIQNLVELFGILLGFAIRLNYSDTNPIARAILIMYEAGVVVGEWMTGGSRSKALGL